MADYIGGVAGRNGNIDLYSKTAVFAPAEVEVKTAPLAGNERKQNQFAPGHLKVPAAVRTGISLRVFAAPHEFLVGHPNDVIIKVVERVTKMPLHGPMLVIRPVPCGRNRIVNVPKPPDRVELVVVL